LFHEALCAEKIESKNGVKLSFQRIKRGSRFGASIEVGYVSLPNIRFLGERGG
jgi:hypothetical protein